MPLLLDAADIAAALRYCCRYAMLLLLRDSIEARGKSERVVERKIGAA